MSIQARYPGTCSVCGKPFRAGTTIEWDSATKRSSHILCGKPSGKPKATAYAQPQARKATPARSTAPAATEKRITQDEADAIIAAQGRTWAIALNGGPTKAVGYDREGKQGPEVGSIVTVGLKMPDKTKESHPALVMSVGKPYYHSQDACDDMDCFCGAIGWKTPYEARRVTLTPEEQAARAHNKLHAAAVQLMDHTPGGTTVSDRASGTLQEPYASTPRVAIWSKTVGYSLHTCYRLTDGILRYQPVYDDSPQWRYVPYTAMDTDIAAHIAALPEVK